MMRTITILLTLAATLAGCAKTETSSFAGSGTIEATEVTVSAESRGQLLTAAFDEGDTVKQGQVIGEIEVKNIRLQRNANAAAIDEIDASRRTIEQEIATVAEALKQAQVSLDNARVTRDRIENLHTQGAATTDRLDRVRTEYEIAESRVRSAEKQLAMSKSRLASVAATRKRTEESLRVLDDQIVDGTVISPLNGVVIEKYADAGEVVNFGTPLCTIADLSSVWLTVYVGEESVGKLSIGGKAGVRLDSFPSRSFEGKITWISPKAEFTPKNVQTRDSRVDLVYAVKITLPNPEGVFKIGMPAEAHIEGI